MPRSIPIGGFGKRWSVRVAKRLSNSWGHCDYNKHEIVLSQESQEHGIDREILIHELTHKLLPWMDEQCVTHFAIELDDALEACGY
jgi:hypothetical protein